VEGVLQDAIGRVVGERPGLSVAGRTDAGVHAEGQVVSFQGRASLDAARLMRAVNAMLAPEVVVLAARRAPQGFDARHSATGREYVYRIHTGPVPWPFTARFVWQRPGRLSVADMRAAARYLSGRHDFTSFCRPPKLPMSTERTLRRLPISVRGNGVEIRAAADGFLHQMVRSLVGTLVAVGEGKLDPAEMPGILAARNRAAAAPVAPPQGLTLLRVLYGSKR
jgi:tRNA pseudouridine38-40 synthase